MTVTNQCLQTQNTQGLRQSDVLKDVQSSVIRIDKSFEDLKSQLMQQSSYHDHTIAMIESTRHTIMYGYDTLWNEVRG